MQIFVVGQYYSAAIDYRLRSRLTFAAQHLRAAFNIEGSDCARDECMLRMQSMVMKLN